MHGIDRVHDARYAFRTLLAEGVSPSTRRGTGETCQPVVDAAGQPGIESGPCLGPQEFSTDPALGRELALESRYDRRQARSPDRPFGGSQQAGADVPVAHFAHQPGQLPQVPVKRPGSRISGRWSGLKRDSQDEALAHELAVNLMAATHPGWRMRGELTQDRADAPTGGWTRALVGQTYMSGSRDHSRRNRTGYLAVAPYTKGRLGYLSVRVAPAPGGATSQGTGWRGVMEGSVRAAVGTVTLFRPRPPVERREGEPRIQAGSEGELQRDYSRAGVR